MTAHDELPALVALLAESDSLAHCPISTFARSLKQVLALLATTEQEEPPTLADALNKLSVALSEEIETVQHSCQATMRTCDHLRAELARAENQVRRFQQRENEAKELQSTCKAALELHLSTDLPHIFGARESNANHNRNSKKDREASSQAVEQPSSASRNRDEMNDEENDNMLLVQCAPDPPRALAHDQFTSRGEELNKGSSLGEIDDPSAAQKEEKPHPVRGATENIAKNHALALVSMLHQLQGSANMNGMTESAAEKVIEAFEKHYFRGGAVLADGRIESFSSDSVEQIKEALIVLTQNVPLQSPKLQLHSLRVIGNVFRPRNNNGFDAFSLLGTLVTEGRLVEVLVKLLCSVNDDVKCEALEYLSPLAGAPHLLPIEAINSPLIQTARRKFLCCDGLDPVMVIVRESTSEAVLERALVLLWGLLSKDESIEYPPGTNTIVSIRACVRELGGLQVLNLLYTESLAIVENASMVIGYITREETSKEAVRLEGGLEKIVATLWHPSVSIKTKMAGAVWNCASTSENRTMLRKLGAIPVLLDLLNTSNPREPNDMDEFVYENAAGALWNLSVDVESKAHILAYGGVETLLRVIETSTNAAVVENVTGTLWNCSASPDSRPLIRKVKGLPVLLSLLSPSDNQQRSWKPTMKVMDNVAGALRNCALDDRNKIAIKDAGGVQVLLAVLQDYQAKVIKLHSSGAAAEKSTSSLLSPSTLDKIASTLWILTIAPEVKATMQLWGGFEVILQILEQSSAVLSHPSQNGRSTLSVIDPTGARKDSSNSSRSAILTDAPESFFGDKLASMPFGAAPLLTPMSIREKLIGVIRNCSTLQENRSDLLASGAVRVLVGTLWDCFSNLTVFRTSGASGKRKVSSEWKAPSPQLCETTASALWYLSRVNKIIPLQQGGLEALCYLVSVQHQAPVVLEQAAGALSSLTAGQKDNCDALMRCGGLEALLRLVCDHSNAGEGVVNSPLLVARSSSEDVESTTYKSALFNVLLSIRNSTTSSERVMAYTANYALQNNYAFSKTLIHIISGHSEDCMREAVYIVKNLCTSEKLRAFFSAEQVGPRLKALIQTSNSDSLRRACSSTLKSIDNAKRNVS